MFDQVHLFDSSVDKAFSDPQLDSLDTSKQVQIFNNSKLFKDGVVLRAVSDALAGKTKPPLDVPSTDADSTTRGYCVVRQTLENSSFSCTIDTEQCKALTLVQTEGYVVDSG